MFGEERPEEIQWWWRPLWKIKSPIKVIIFMWLATMNKALTWEVL
jgi:hypothetical protein